MPWLQRTWCRKDKRQGAVAASADYQNPTKQNSEGQNTDASRSLSFAATAKALLLSRRRLRLNPDKRLHFLYEPGKQVASAVKIKNISSSPVAIKVQTTAPKSCFIRPPSGILAPGETIITSIVKFIEPPEQTHEKQDKKANSKFKVVSLKVDQGVEFTPELFDDHKEFVVEEKVLKVVFLDPHSKSPEIEKLKKLLAEAEAAQQSRKKQVEDKVQKTVAAGGVLDEWKEQQREKRLSQAAS